MVDEFIIVIHIHLNFLNIQTFYFFPFSRYFNDFLRLFRILVRMCDCTLERIFLVIERTSKYVFRPSVNIYQQHLLYYNCPENVLPRLYKQISQYVVYMADKSRWKSWEYAKIEGTCSHAVVVNVMFHMMWYLFSLHVETWKQIIPAKPSYKWKLYHACDNKQNVDVI